MAQEKIQNGIRIFSLASSDGQTRAEVVPELGGTVSSLILQGPDGPRECLHRRPWFWDAGTDETRGGLPLLFPICGRLLKENTPGLVHFTGQPFILPIHGFAMRLPWQVVEAGRPDALRLRLADSAPTRAMYPFAFELALLVRVSAAGFFGELTIRNTGGSPMPFCAGLHPYFATPPAGAGKEQTVFVAHPRARLLYDETKTALIGRAPAPSFPMSIAGDDINGLLLEVGGRGDSGLVFPDGFELRQTASPLFRYRQFHTLPGEPFFCDEPWMAPAGAMNRPGGARILQPGQSESGAIHIAPSPPRLLFSRGVALS
ncbi:MAG: hypothetical protein EOM72_11555 [Opitutae bacterium]|nr:hypothetical protein [Opitutae bacterium]